MAPLPAADDLARVVDGVEPIVLHRRGEAEVQPLLALRSRVRLAEAAPAQAMVLAEDAAFRVAMPPGVPPPQPGDRLVDAGEARWTVLAVAWGGAAGVWRCQSRNLFIPGGLDQRIDVERAEYRTTSGGAEVPQWEPYLADVPARIQPVAAEVAERQGRQVTWRQYTVYLAEPLCLAAEHRLRGPDGAVYRVLACRRAERIDMLTEVDAERVE